MDSWWTPFKVNDLKPSKLKVFIENGNSEVNKENLRAAKVEYKAEPQRNGDAQLRPVVLGELLFFLGYSRYSIAKRNTHKLASRYTIEKIKKQFPSLTRRMDRRPLKLFCTYFALFADSFPKKIDTKHKYVCNAGDGCQQLDLRACQHTLWIYLCV